MMIDDFTKRTLHQAERWAYDVNTDGPTKALLLDLITVVTNLQLEVETLVLEIKDAAL